MDPHEALASMSDMMRSVRSSLSLCDAKAVTRIRSILATKCSCQYML